MRNFGPPLPIDEVLISVSAALGAKRNAVLVAPPGAGKTTRVPLALLDEPWARGKMIVLAEPRRLAARAAAQRMAETLGEKVGETIGLRIRMEARSSAKTRILVVTEGVFTRMILDDPTLADCAAILFDEFHERSLDADLGLALALDAQQGFCEDLRILAMSATLDGARVARLMGDAPVLESQGRAFPVTTHYLGRDSRERLEPAILRAIFSALDRETGSLLVFLPGQREIERLAALLQENLRNSPRHSNVLIAPLYGALEKRSQDQAIATPPPGMRKIVLATSVAETSLTIEGVRTVIDSGLARTPRYEPELGLTRLETVRASRAAVDQRRGRAGRTQPGVCFRLWEEAATGALPAFAQPEILSADLAGLVLDLAEWGVRARKTLSFLDAPPESAWNEAQKLLRHLGALDADGAITPKGKVLRALPLSPRLARMVLEAAQMNQAEEAAEIAILLSERGLGGDSVDLTERLERFLRESGPRAQNAKAMARRWALLARDALSVSERKDIEKNTPLSTGALIALAFPERVARARGRRGDFLMVNGRAAAVEPHERLAEYTTIAVAEATGRAAQARILSAAPIAQEEIERLFAPAIEQRAELTFDKEKAALRAKNLRKLGAIALDERNLSVAPGPEAAQALAAGLASLGLARLPWSPAQMQLRARVAFLRRMEGDVWPDLSDETLAPSIQDWLAPFIEGARGLSDLSADTMTAALAGLLPWDKARQLDIAAPTHFATPAGSQIPIDYSVEGGPAIHVRVQELFGLKTHPSVQIHPTSNSAATPLTLHLTSPAHRPIQITRDLPSFWRGAWADVRADMRGRYPRHPWPEDPANAPPTARAKPRGT